MSKLVGVQGKIKVEMVEFTCVAAVGPSGQLGEENGLPWPPGSIRGDMTYFKKLTLSKISYTTNGSVLDVSSGDDLANVVIMGRKTWDSIPTKFKPLESRLNIVITSSSSLNFSSPNVITACSFEDALSKAEKCVQKTHGQIFVIGGSSIYNAAICHPNCIGIFLTEISGPMKPGDVFLPVDEIKTKYQNSSVSRIGYELICESCKNISFDDTILSEKSYKYQFNFYHKPK